MRSVLESAGHYRGNLTTDIPDAMPSNVYYDDDPGDFDDRAEYSEDSAK